MNKLFYFYAIIIGKFDTQSICFVWFRIIGFKYDGSGTCVKKKKIIYNFVKIFLAVIITFLREK